ncbi:MAG: SulP family inorganic anion transporter [Porphyromonadaceae bacterium]|nr:SulP family inorganic anion transporter [Porphyromonadaceae bacterium]
MSSFPFRPRLVEALRGYSRSQLSTDMMAGVIVGIVALPLAIAFAVASGVSPEVGLITAVIGGFIVSALGGSSVQIGGPTGAFIVIVYGVIEQYGLSGLLISTFLAGVLLVLMGALRLGTLIKFIPYPIIVGFTAGIALTIFSTQINDLLGLGIEGLPADFISKWGVLLSNISTAHWVTALIGLGSIAIIQLTPRLTKVIPGSFVAIVLMTLVVYLLREHFAMGGVETIGDRFTISNEFPPLVVPELSFETIRHLAAPTFTIAMLGAIESLLSASVADGVIGERHDSNTELIAQGVANMVVPFFGGIPVTGAIARTMTNINNGGRSPISGIVHAVSLLLIFLFLMPLTSYIPMACLAGVLVVVSYNMSGWRSIRAQWSGPKGDLIVLLVTFALTVLFDLTIAIEIGLLLAMLFFMRRMVETTRILVSRDELNLMAGQDDHRHSATETTLSLPAGVEVYEIEGPFFFGIANRFEELMASAPKRPKVRILRMRFVPFMDSTAVYNLGMLCEKSKAEGIQIILSGVNERVRATLSETKVEVLIGSDNICPDIQSALAKAETYTKQ